MRSPLGFGIREASPASRRGSSTPGWVLHSRRAQAFEEIALKMLQGNIQQTSDERKPRGCLPSLCPPAQVGVKPLRTIPGGFSVAESKAGAFVERDVPVRRSRRTAGRLHISGWGWPRSSVASRVLQKALSGQKGDFGWAWDEGSGLTAAPSLSPCPGRAGAGSQAPRAAARGAALRRPAGKAKVLLGFSEGRSRWPGPAASGMRTSWSLAVTWGRRGREGGDAWQGDGA